ncbi:glutathione-disulfide reductase [Azomonas macrocytogenes]|uniref:Glutathione reductase (NADPH) n=1 Tax=Azomonas macrocytogenes TaxID=69962 RepID=A0A839T8Q0_AZOMA|nr:glutathione-disulfide reductase [Azomonas macrocytogenes]MBB3104023.1 glutathione reductase (NADPH) [Azomonas macrocytogenes]
MAYDFDLFVIGAGSGGVRAARFASSFGARVAVAESRYLGGTCVNVGCVPKKLLVYGANYAEDIDQAKGYGWSVDGVTFDWATLIASKNSEIERLNGIYKNLLVESGVTLFQEHAQILDAHRIEVAGKSYTSEHILIATGGWPHVPEFPGNEHVITSNEAFYLPSLPKRTLVVGGGYIAVEFASILNGCGSETRLLYRGELFMRGFDGSLRDHLKNEMIKKGIDLQFNTDIARVDKQADGTLKATLKDGRVMEADCILYATGRRPMLDNLGLENVEIERDKRGYLVVDNLFQTTTPSILAIGDVIGRIQLTPVALAEGMAVARHLFKPEEYRPVDYKLIPTAVFSLPNLATVGLTEEEAREKGVRLRIYESRFRPMKLTLTDTQERSLMKLVVDAETDKVLGCHMAGPEAGEIMQGFAVALKAGATKRIFDETVGIHPSAAEEFVTMRTPAKVD